MCIYRELLTPLVYNRPTVDIISLPLNADVIDRISAPQLSGRGRASVPRQNYVPAWSRPAFMRHVNTALVMGFFPKPLD